MTDRTTTPQPSKLEARRWIRKHWAELIRQADFQIDAPPEAALASQVWEDECSRIADHIVKRSNMI